MPTVLTGTSTYLNTASGPADGDTRNAASVNTPLQTVLNNTKWLYDHGRLIYTDQLDTNSSSSAVTSATWTDVYTAVSIPSLEVNDLVYAELHCTVQAGSAGAVAHYAQARAVIVDNAVEYTSTRVGGIRVAAGAFGYGCLSAVARRVIGTAGTATAKVQIRVSVADGVFNDLLLQNAHLIVRAWRPVS